VASWQREQAQLAETVADLKSACEAALAVFMDIKGDIQGEFIGV
jgi:hypothetical protein